MVTEIAVLNRNNSVDTGRKTAVRNKISFDKIFVQLLFYLLVSEITGDERLNFADCR